MSYLRFTSSSIAHLKAVTIVVNSASSTNAVVRTAEIMDVVDTVLYTRENTLNLHGLVQLATWLQDRYLEHNALRADALASGDDEIAAVHYDYMIECEKIIAAHCTPSINHATAQVNYATA